MLASLRIAKLALIDDLEIPLSPGLTVLTGETGAGKSIIVGAVGLILGDRAAPELIRQGEDEASVEVLFDVEAGGPAAEHLSSVGVAVEDGQLSARRTVNRAGKSRAYINGRLSTLAELKRTVGPLIDLSSQHAHTSLLDTATHRVILDRFGELGRVMADYTEQFTAWRSAEAAWRELLAAEKGRAERVELLRFQVSEIDAVAPRRGEEQALEQELHVLRHASELLSATREVEDRLYGRRGALTEALADLERTLSHAATRDATLAQLAARLESTRIELEDVGQEVRAYRSRVTVDPRRLAQAEERFTELDRLSRRFGPTVDEVVDRRAALSTELEALEGFDERVQALERSAKQARVLVEAAAHRLSEARRRVARRVTEQIEAQLADLGMKNARFEVQLQAAATLGPAGLDAVEFLLSSNVGEAPLPLARIASGGELSRIMLALKRVLGEVDTVELYVFDEVDTGVSGAVAERIGQKLRETARRRQALCITHLPQVACQADAHLRVHKAVEGGRTVTRVTPLDGAGRLEELAQLLAGVEVTDVARAHAAELLARARA